MKKRKLHPFLELRRNPKNLLLDASGYWSYPALVVVKDSLQWVCLVLPTMAMPEKKRTALFRPKALVQLKANTPTLVRYESFRLGIDPFANIQWDKPIAMFPHKDLWGMTYQQLSEAEDQLMNSYADAGESFLATKALPATFIESYVKILHPAFLPYLRHLAPDFITALKVKTRLT